LEIAVYNPQLGWLLTGLGYVVGVLVFMLALRRMPPAQVAQLTWQQRLIVLAAALAGGILGAKLTQWLALGWPVSLPLDSIIDPRHGGRTILGGVICGWIAVEIAKRFLGIRYSLGAPFALGLCAGEAVGRIGCLFNACCIGCPLSGSFGSPLTADELPYPSLLRGIWQYSDWRYPVQLYSSLALVALFALLWWLRPRLVRDGDLFYVYLLAGGLLRFALEFYRASEKIWHGLSLAQLVSLELAAAGAVVLLIRWWQIVSREAARVPPV
jgi:phosphatidylglycerol:prolipoprotein diacylglycerol transferase